MLADRVEFVVVAGGAPGGEPEENGGGGIGAVAGVAGFGLGFDGAALGGGEVETIVAGGDQRVEAGGAKLAARRGRGGARRTGSGAGRGQAKLGIGDEITGELFDGETVERHVGVEGADDPVAVGPDVADVVEVEAVGVGVAHGIEPEARELFTVARRGEETGDEGLDRGVGIAFGAGEEGVDLGGRGREAGQVEGETADEDGGRRLGGEGKVLAGEFLQNERVEGIGRGLRVER